MQNVPARAGRTDTGEPGFVLQSDLREHLRWLADTYERVQSIRLEAGERIRAVAQGRTAGFRANVEPADALLARIRSGIEDGPVPVLGATYRLHFEEERRLRAAMEDVLGRHAAWPWLAGVKGVGPTVSAKLLARLDISRASTPSSFWAYCGLATVPGVEYACALCGARNSFAVGYRISGKHRGNEGSECAGVQVAVRGPEDGVRVAQPRPRAGDRPVFDRHARRVCYQIGVSLLRARGSYAAFYRQQRRKLAHERPGWTRAHQHMAALRKTEKLFLAHLWLMWSSAAGLPTNMPYACARLDKVYIDPAEMVDRRAQPAARASTGAVEAENPQ